jgi:endo-1,4-beta-xylanase
LPDPQGFSGAEVSLSYEMKEKLNPYRGELPAEMQNRLAERYAELFAVYLKHHRSIERVTFWNVTDRESWLNNFPVRGRTNHPLLFDRQGNAKPAFQRVVESVKIYRRS